MSFALWRIHESVHRNDLNQLFLLSDDQSLRSIAPKLNIVVLSSNDFRLRIENSLMKTNVNMIGELELLGLAKPKQHGDNHTSNGSAPKSSDGLHLDDQETKAQGAVPQPEGQEKMLTSNTEVFDKVPTKDVVAEMSQAPLVTTGEVSGEVETGGPKDQPTAAQPVPKSIDPKELVSALLNPPVLDRHQPR